MALHVVSYCSLKNDKGPALFLQKVPSKSHVTRDYLSVLCTAKINSTSISCGCCSSFGKICIFYLRGIELIGFPDINTKIWEILLQEEYDWANTYKHGELFESCLANKMLCFLIVSTHDFVLYSYLLQGNAISTQLLLYVKFLYLRGIELIGYRKLAFFFCVVRTKIATCNVKRALDSCCLSRILQILLLQFQDLTSRRIWLVYGIKMANIPNRVYPMRNHSSSKSLCPGNTHDFDVYYVIATFDWVLILALQHRV